MSLGRTFGAPIYPSADGVVAAKAVFYSGTGIYCMLFKLRMRSATLYLLTVVIVVCLQAGESLAQESGEVSSSTTVEATETSTLESLNSIARAIERNRVAIKEKQQSLNRREESGRENELRAEIVEISQDIERLEQSFRQLAAGVDLTPLRESSSEQQFHLGTELAALLKPLVNELQQLTAAPREIDELKGSIEKLRSSRALTERALTQTRNQLELAPEKGTTRELLRASADHWKNQVEELSTHLEIETQKLQQRLASQVPISESLGNLFEIFFKTRGRNLLVAILLSVLFYLGIAKLYEALERIPLVRRSKSSNISRLLALGYLVTTVVGTAFTFILVLYISGDWLLLTIAVLLMISLVWASREALPKYWAQLALLVNVGPVREGQRVVVNGVPWLVDHIHLYTRLINPLLSGGVLRLPLADLTALRSREVLAHEPYFPTHEGDWVLLPGERLARVVLQSPEVVQLVELGGARHSIPTSDFVQLGAVNLSEGFRLLSAFGIDYQHQEISTTEVPRILESFIRGRIESDFPELQYKHLAVEFQAAGASSLDLAIIFDVEGSGAALYPRLQRALQQYAVEACNANGWVIPFTQMNVHFAQNPLQVSNG